MENDTASDDNLYNVQQIKDLKDLHSKSDSNRVSNSC